MILKPDLICTVIKLTNPSINQLINGYLASIHVSDVGEHKESPMFISPSSCSSLVPWTIFRTSIISSCCGFVVGGFSIYQPFFRVVANRHPRHSVFTNCVATLPRLIIYGDPNSLLHSVPSWPSQRHQRAPAYSALFPDWSTTSVEAWTRANRTFLGNSSRFVVLYFFLPQGTHSADFLLTFITYLGDSPGPSFPQWFISVDV